MPEPTQTTLTEDDIADLPPEVIAQLSRPVREMAERLRRRKADVESARLGTVNNEQ
jgi:hypothetical protein